MTNSLGDCVKIRQEKEGQLLQSDYLSCARGGEQANSASSYHPSAQSPGKESGSGVFSWLNHEEGNKPPKRRNRLFPLLFLISPFLFPESRV